MTRSPKEHLLGIVGVLIAATLWGMTGVFATFAPAISSAEIGAAAMAPRRFAGLLTFTVLLFR